jgi:regulatory protein
LADEALAAALRAIGRKERTEAEMRSWLADREYDQDEIDRVLAYLIENLAVDDARYAMAFTADKRELSGWGRVRIEATLARRGVPRELIAAALGHDDGESEVDRAARVLVERDFPLEDPKDRQRAMGLLARRGFGAEDSYAAIRRAGEREG